MIKLANRQKHIFINSTLKCLLLINFLMINAKECVIIDSWHTFKKAWLLEEHIMRKPQILLFDLNGTLNILWKYYANVKNVGI